MNERKERKERGKNEGRGKERIEGRKYARKGKMEGREGNKEGKEGRKERRRKRGKISPWFPDSWESFLQRDDLDFCVGVLY